MRQYLYSCTSKASKMSTCGHELAVGVAANGDEFARVL
jgi:hypothetical protein